MSGGEKQGGRQPPMGYCATAKKNARPKKGGVKNQTLPGVRVQ